MSERVPEVNDYLLWEGWCNECDSRVVVESLTGDRSRAATDFTITCPIGCGEPVTLELLPEGPRWEALVVERGL